MARIERFEDIEAWQKARELTRQVYRYTVESLFAKDYGLRDQIRRAAVSVMSNIAEGFERGGNKEFRQFLSMAKGSAGEVKSHLYVALDAGYIDQSSFNALYACANDTSRMTGGLMRYIEMSGQKGAKFT
ncbi:MAG: four helix bundle protein [Deltaproteobacteria bacterium HGW-Deltaproteobacteria-15]|jgi:four helix bundle protein|nr:MAG: four helix bundle protein [Deltaproteobacteria bacterium HGW-Deltaproteobacteria-15]